MLNKYKGKLFCFSPPVMLATFLIEFGFAIYTLWRYKLTTVSRLAIAILLSLGIFQLAEYMICGGLGLQHIEWARIGYVSITLLPALGIHMLTAITGKKRPMLVGSAYAICAIIVIYYLIDSASVSGELCYANYAVFHNSIAQWFTAYYYGWLIIGTYLAWQWGMEQPLKRKTLHWMMVGYLSFLVPTTTINLIDSTTVKGVPSIMCGFAVLLAFVITLKVMPLTGQIRSRGRL